MNKSTLILGIGNILMGDEGVGVHIAKMLESVNLPDHVNVLDGGTGGFHLLEYFDLHDHIIMIDATLDGLPPGNVRQIKPRFALDFPPAMSTHDIGLKDLVSALQLLGRMPEIDLFVVSIKSIQQQGINLTEAVQNASAAVIEKIKEMVENEKVDTTH
ncbi:MAG: hydrogenase maturation protease [Saprospiraceae bacterium]|nr:hydrogenase maturation protease [Saprospiraceae bacterium]